MKNLKIRYVLGIDPSGSFHEGKGRTGWCVYDRQLEVITRCGEIKANAYKAQEAYWLAHKFMIDKMWEDYRAEGMVVSMEDYVLYSNSAKSQVNSAMETCQLIGVLKVHCYIKAIPLRMRTASQVMKRWADSILVHNNIMYKTDKSYFTQAYAGILSEHIKDSFRHALHCATFELKENE